MSASTTATPTTNPTVTVVATGVTFAAPGGAHDQLTELVEVAHLLGAGRVRGDLVELSYDLSPDGTRLVTGFQVVSSAVTEGAAADLSRHRSAIGGVSTCGHLHTTKENRR